MSQARGGAVDTHAAALAKAAEARRRRAELEEHLAAGAVTLGELFALADADPLVGGIKAVVMLQSLPGIGKVRSRRTMEALGVAASSRLSEVAGPERRALLDALTSPDGAAGDGS